MNRRDPSIRNSLLAVVAAGLLTLAGGARAAAASQLEAHASDGFFWIARVTVPPASESKQGVQTVVRARPVGEPLWTSLGRPAGRVVSLAHRGDAAALLLDDGRWLLLWPGGMTLGAQPDDGATLLALAAGGEAMWAIAAGRESDGGDLPATRSSTSGEILSLYRLDRGRWRWRAALPAHVTRQVMENVSLAVVRGDPSLAMLDEGGNVDVFRWDSASEAWSRLQRLAVSGATTIKLMSDGDGLVLWAAPAAGGGQIWVSRGENWNEPRDLSVQGPLVPGAARTVTLAGQSLRFLFVHDDRIFEQVFTLDGRAGRPAMELPALPVNPGALPNRLLTAAAAAMLVIVVLSSLRRTAGVPQTPGDLAAGVRPAPLLPRFAAGLVDAAPLIVTSYFVFRALDPQAREFEQILDSMTYPFYTALGAYLVYTCLFEALFARTIGKMLFGLRVVSLDGSRARAGAIVARNALRLVDVTMLAVPLIVVMLSPLRQRVGDIAAGTIVVRSRPTAEPAAGDSPADHQSIEPTKPPDA